MWCNHEETPLARFLMNATLSDRKRSPHPVLTHGEPGSWDETFVADPFVTRGPDGRYWLFYEGYKEPFGRIGAAHSFDGIHFTRYGNNPVLDRAPTHCSYPQVFRVGDRYYMHLEGEERVIALYSTHAEDFPVGWRRVGVTVRRGRRGAWDSGWVGDGTIFPCRDRWYMLYSGGYRRTYSIGLALLDGPDLIGGRWRKLGKLRFPPGRGWPFGQVRMAGDVVCAGEGEFVFFFQANSSRRLHLYATESDQQVGVGRLLIDEFGHPSAYVRTSPLLGPSDNLWDRLHTHHVTVVATPTGWRLYYDGEGVRDAWRIGMIDVDRGECRPAMVQASGAVDERPLWLPLRLVRRRKPATKRKIVRKSRPV